MDFKKFGNKYIVRIDKGEEILGCLKKLCMENGIKLGMLSGIGAVNKATIGFFETATKEYHSAELVGGYEITSLLGNISTMNNEVYLHIHVNLSDEKHAVCGGHLNSAVVSATCEVVIDAIEGEVYREFSDEIGLNLFRMS